MNETFLLALLVLGVVTALLTAFAFKMKKDKWKHKADYNSFFILGICLLPLGITLDMPIFFIIGVTYIAIGIINKDKKGKEIKMTEKQRKMQIIVVIVGLAILAVFVASIFILGQV